MAISDLDRVMIDFPLGGVKDCVHENLKKMKGGVIQTTIEFCRD
jgi:hypothetical protein